MRGEALLGRRTDLDEHVDHTLARLPLHALRANILLMVEELLPVTEARWPGLLTSARWLAGMECWRRTRALECLRGIRVLVG